MRVILFNHAACALTSLVSDFAQSDKLSQAKKQPRSSYPELLTRVCVGDCRKFGLYFTHITHFHCLDQRLLI
jgi:hypothetical protein